MLYIALYTIAARPRRRATSLPALPPTPLPASVECCPRPLRLALQRRQGGREGGREGRKSSSRQRSFSPVRRLLRADAEPVAHAAATRPAHRHRSLPRSLFPSSSPIFTRVLPAFTCPPLCANRSRPGPSSCCNTNPRPCLCRTDHRGVGTSADCFPQECTGATVRP